MAGRAAYAEKTIGMEGIAEKKTAKAKIISIDERMGIMTIECPNDIQQHEVPIGTKEFICPVDGTLLLL